MGVVITLAGQAKFAAAAADGGAPIVLQSLAVGDGNGAPITPLQTMTSLVNEVHRVAIDAAVVDETNANWLKVTSEIPGEAGPFWIREVGLFDQDGVLIAVANYPDTYKSVAAMGVVTALQIQMILVVSSTANVQVAINPSNYATQEWVINRKVPMSQLTNLPFLPVKSFTLTAPPVGPVAGDLYGIPTGATGAWAGHANRLAEWSGTAWTILIPPDGHLIGTPNGKFYRRLAGIYSETTLTTFASEAEHLAGVSLTLMTNPSGVAKMIKALRDELVGYLTDVIAVTGNVNAKWGQEIWCYSASGPITVTLPDPTAQPDVTKRAPITIHRIGANDVTVARNGQPIADLAENFIINRNKAGVRTSYVSTGWRLDGRRVA